MSLMLLGTKRGKRLGARREEDHPAPEIVAIVQGHPDPIVFGRHYIANPDLVERMQVDAEIVEPAQETLYTQGAEGYIDYPPMAR